MARIGDWRQIENIRELPAFLGLVLTERSTGERTNRGSMTHNVDLRLRSKLIEASWLAIRQDDELREFFRSVAKRHPRHRGTRVAIVAVAHKLCVRAAVVLMKQRPYEVRQQVPSAPLTKEETVPQGTTRRLRSLGSLRSPNGSTLETESTGRSAFERGASQVSVTALCRATYSSESLLGG